jgi:hypothetical protein
MPGYSYAGHPWHQYVATGPASLLELAAPFLALGVLVLVLMVAEWGRHRIETLRSRARRAATASRALATRPTSVQPVLASDADREEASRRVSYAIGEGRLSFEEGGQRIDDVLRGRHRHELAALVADLPAVPAADARPSSRSALRVGVLAAAAGIVLAAVLVQAAAGLWELWPVAVAVLGAAALLPRR